MNSFGRFFCIYIYGESHGRSIGVIIDGCPPGIPLSAEDFKSDLNRRKGGAKGTTMRMEEDEPQILSGVFEGNTTGAPVNIMFENRQAQPDDYIREIPRPGHADYVAKVKYKDYNDYRGGGHFSGRLTLALVSAGVIAKKIIAGMVIDAKLIEAGGQAEYREILETAVNSGDSLGGIVECRVSNVPAGLGEPFFDSLESQFSHICFAIPGIRGIEFGAGFKSAKMRGSEHNDIILPDGKTATNHAGGINGGISNGNELVFRVAVKPTSSIRKEQITANLKTGEMVGLQIDGRHDVCFALRVPVVVEAAAAIVLADNLLLSKAY